MHGALVSILQLVCSACAVQEKWTPFSVEPYLEHVHYESSQRKEFGMQPCTKFKRQIRQLLPGQLTFTLFWLFLFCGVYGISYAQNTLDRPFSSSSVWNTRISSGAVYTAAGFSSQQQFRFFFEGIRIHKVNYADPLRRVYEKKSDGYCLGSYNIDTSKVHYDVNIPDSLIYNRIINNGIVTFLFPDGRVKESYRWERCFAGSTAAGRWKPSEWYYVTGDGLPQLGRHLGSLLPGLGGVIRKGELATPAGVPIPHALKLALATAVLYYNPSDPTPGYRWPAKTRDGYASTYYRGRNPAVEMGSLIAIHRSQTESSLGLRTEPAKKVFKALQIYGGYVVDSCCLQSADGWMLGAELGASNQNLAAADLQNVYGISLSGTNLASNNFRLDMRAIYDHLMVITNTSPQHPKGMEENEMPAPDNLRIVSQ